MVRTTSSTYTCNMQYAHVDMCIYGKYGGRPNQLLDKFSRLKISCNKIMQHETECDFIYLLTYLFYLL